MISNIKVGDEYKYSFLEKVFVDGEFTANEYGNNTVGDNFVVFEHDHKDERYSFVLAGTVGNEYVYRCCYANE